MKEKKSLLVLILMMAITWNGFGDDLIDLGDSNTKKGTASFVTNEYDWMLNPLNYSLLESSTLFLSMDADGSQFSAGSVGAGIRGGFALINTGLSPIFALNYFNDSDSTTPEEADNVVYTYSTYDIATGNYASINGNVNIKKISKPNQELKVHFGGSAGESINFAVQAWLKSERYESTSLAYTDTYTNTTAASDATLSSKGDQTETVNNVPTFNNVLAFEPEIGLKIGSIESLISFGFGMYNILPSENSSVSTVSTYSTGIDPIIMDSQTITSTTGHYYNSDSNSFIDMVFMNTSTPTYAPKLRVSLNTDNTMSIDENTEVVFPIAFGMTFYPEAETTSSTTNITFDDSTGTALESNRTNNLTAISLSSTYDMEGVLGALYKKTFKPSDKAALHLGGGLNIEFDINEFTRSQVFSVTTQKDNNGNNVYTDAVDVNTVYKESGYEIRTTDASYDFIVSFPVAIEYSPIKSLKFYAGTTTKLTTNLGISTTLTTGDSGYIYEEYTDNNNADNNYALRQKDTSNNTSQPSNDFSTNFDISVDGTFGFSLDLADNFKVDALAATSGVGFYKFSLTCIYSFK